MNKTHSSSPWVSICNIAVIVAALGYFVDIYDLILFSIVRIPSLKSLGLSGEDLTSQGLLILNVQMIGMLIGGIGWGILGDKKGRLAVLFGSILLYSLANLANARVDTISQYLALRFIAGIGLAGELGAGITLVSEVLPKHHRGYGTTLVATVGICGAVLAAKVTEWTDWRTAYTIGGVLGIALLLLRIRVFESGLFGKAVKTSVARGNFFELFTSRARFIRYLSCILVGLPTWFVIGILVGLAPEFSKTMGVVGEVTAARSVMYAYIGLAIGDFTSGLLSQWLASRKKVILIFMVLTLFTTTFYSHLNLFFGTPTPDVIYGACLALGFGVGFWAVFVTIGAEQFGTNLRATVATTVPNFARGALVPITIAFTAAKVTFGMLWAAQIVGVLTVGVALVALSRLDESFHKDLDYFDV